MKLYHLTNVRSLDRILQDGILPRGRLPSFSSQSFLGAGGECNLECVYLCNKRGISIVSNWLEGDQAILEIDGNALDSSLFLPDEKIIPPYNPAFSSIENISHALSFATSGVSLRKKEGNTDRYILSIGHKEIEVFMGYGPVGEQYENSDTFKLVMSAFKAYWEDGLRERGVVAYKGMIKPEWIVNVRIEE